MSQPEIGRIIRYPVKGIIVYVTASEAKAINDTFWTEVCSALVAVAALLVGGIKNFQALMK